MLNLEIKSVKDLETGQTVFYDKGIIKPKSRLEEVFAHVADDIIFSYDRMIKNFKLTDMYKAYITHKDGKESFEVGIKHTSGKQDVVEYSAKIELSNGILTEREIIFDKELVSALNELDKLSDYDMEKAKESMSKHVQNMYIIRVHEFLRTKAVQFGRLEVKPD